MAFTGFLIAAATMPLAVLTNDPMICVAWFCLAVFGLELTVGVSWAVTLDIGGAIASVATCYIVTRSGWIPAFMVLSVLSLVAALLFLRIDASNRLYR